MGYEYFGKCLKDGMQGETVRATVKLSNVSHLLDVLR